MEKNWERSAKKVLGQRQAIDDGPVYPMGSCGYLPVLHGY
jgi:hypothetical protein